MWNVKWARVNLHKSLFTDVGRRIKKSADEQENFNHKPILNCEGYKPEIEEEQPAGTYVIDVIIILTTQKQPSKKLFLGKSARC